MAPISLGSYRSIYLKTAKEYIDKMSVSFNTLTNNSSDKEALNNLHIASHSLKSQSQVMGFTDIAGLCSTIEKKSNDILNGISQVDDTFKVLLKKSVDKITKMLKQVQYDTLRKTL